MALSLFYQQFIAMHDSGCQITVLFQTQARF